MNCSVCNSSNAPFTCGRCTQTYCSSSCADDAWYKQGHYALCNSLEFHVPRSRSGLKAELKARRVSVLFDYPDDFRADGAFIVQTFYPSVSGLPVLDDFLSKWITHHAFVVDKTIFYSHMLELLLNTPDNPGQIIFDSGSSLKMAIYDREYEAALLTDEIYAKKYAIFKSRTEKMLQRYFPARVFDFSFYEEMFVRKLGASLGDIARMSSAIYENAMFLYKKWKPRPSAGRPETFAEDHMFDAFMKQASPRVLTLQLYESFAKRFVPQLEIETVASHLEDVMSIQPPREKLSPVTSTAKRIVRRHDGDHVGARGRCERKERQRGRHEHRARDRAGGPGSGNDE